MKWILLLLISVGCNKCPEKVPPFTWETIPGREEVVGIVRPIYRVKVHRDWVRIDEPRALNDTTVPNITYLIENDIHLTVHTFPSTPIAPRQQIDRWKEPLALSSIKPFSHSGFSGLFLEGEHDDKKTLAWAFQLDPELTQRLGLLASSVAEKLYYEQLAADFTIKVSGPKKKLAEHRYNIFNFANSIELIEAIP